MSSVRGLVYRACGLGLLGSLLSTVAAASGGSGSGGGDGGGGGGRERVNINKDWRFWRSEKNPDGIIYDYRHDLEDLVDVAVMKPWILPSGNDFIADPADRHEYPDEPAPGGNISYIQTSFDDSDWETVKLPHDWAIEGPFYVGDNPVVSGGMGRLPIHGVGWYRRKLDYSSEDEGKQIYLDIDGAMSYTMVWLNGQLVGGWPYGYNSFRLDLTPYLEPGSDNQLAIRLDNPLDSARWYSGGGIYRNVWLTKVNPTHIGHWGTHITSKDITASSATVDIAVEVENHSDDSQKVTIKTKVHEYNTKKGKADKKVAEFAKQEFTVKAGEKTSAGASVQFKNPKLWGPPPTQKPNLYIALTELYVGHEKVDTYETRFGIRDLEFNADEGFFINGEHVELKGVNEHHDLGALGAAFNVRAAERKLEILRELGVNGVRMAHNPPAIELLELTDELGFIVMDEIFDSWERNKTDGDFHLIFPDWHEPDLRNFIRRDRNYPSIVSWSIGNEVGEQYTDVEGAALARHLHDIVMEEDPTRPTTASMNYAKPDMPFGHAVDILTINYQGAGIRDTPNYSWMDGIKTHPNYPDFHDNFPNSMIIGSETASLLSVRGAFIFPVVDVDTGAPVNDTSGGNQTARRVSDYGLYTANFGSPPDKVWLHQDTNPFVAGEFVWTGFDYIGEPTPYYSTRSSYCGILDLAGFKKERYWQYQARWRPELKTARILPHWNWPERVGEVTPVHVFSSADKAELFVNGESQGVVEKAEHQYRFRWDDVVYEPGEVRVKTWKNGEKWAEDKVQTTGKAAALRLSADRDQIRDDGLDLSFVTVEVVDDKGRVVPDAANEITFSVEGPGEIAGTDNGDPADMVALTSTERKALSGLALAIVRADEGASSSSSGNAGKITLRAEADGLRGAKLSIRAK